MRAQTTISEETSPVGGRRRPWIHSRRAVLLALIPAAAIAAACGSSSTGSTSNTTKAPTSTGSGPPAVQTANNPKFGTILVDSQGRTLYTFVTGTGAAAPCSGACLTIWPAALLPAGQTTVSTAPGVSNVTAVSANGGMQVAYKGLPLYRFSGDPSAGAANGDGLNTFGGLWHVVKTSGGTSGTGGSTGGTSPGGAASTTTTTSGGGYGGGY